LETGEDESRNGFLNLTPQKSMDKSILFATIVPPSSKAQRFWDQGIVRLVLLVKLVGLNRTNRTN
jgi:hypothetical protein